MSFLFLYFVLVVYVSVLFVRGAQKTFIGQYFAKLKMNSTITLNNKSILGMIIGC